MIKKIIFSLVLATSSIFNAQILDEYPKNQDFYEGGNVQFYKEINEILVKNKSEECNTNEIYQPRIIVTKEATVQIIKDYDEENITKNKCAYDKAMFILKNLSKWKPAVVQDNKFGAITEFIIYPKDLMGNYKEGYNADRYVIGAQYPKGFKAFNKDFHDNFMALFSDYHINGKVNLEFYINQNGEIINPRIYPPIDNKSFNVDFMRTLSRLKKRWKPALYSNIPIKDRIAFPVNFSINFESR